MNPAPARELKLGLIGLDTSHVLVFSDMFNHPASKLALAGARVTVAWPGGSPDLHSSISRVPGYTAEVRDKFGVTIVDSPEAVAAVARLDRVAESAIRRQSSELAPVRREVDSFIR